MTGHTEADIPDTGAIFTFGRSSFSDNVPSKFWLKNDLPVHVTCGREHSAVITENGRLLMFGSNACGQLGLRLKPAANKPSSVKALKSEKVKLVACGRDHTIVCTSLGRVYGAGSNQEGQLGLGHYRNTRTFQLLPSFCECAQIKMLSAGSSTSAALTEEGRLFMWGDNSTGQIGLGDELCATKPQEVNVGEAVIWVSCGHRHSAFVTVHGDLYTFGDTANGRLGLQGEQLANHKVPQRVQGILGRVTQVCCGGEHTVALTGEDVHTFGQGRYGQLGHGTFQFEVCLPEPLKHFHNSSIRHIACGENHTAVITRNGLLYTFGDGRYGKLGLGEENFINQFSPTLSTRFLPYNVHSVSCGSHHMLVMAAPRPPGSQEVELDNDVIITDYIMEANYDNILLKDSLIYPAPVIPVSALAARARHREKKSFVELFGKKFDNFPRLNSGFQTWKKLPKDVTTPTSSPKPQSEATERPLLSPRSPSISTHSVAMSSKPSSPQSSYSRHSKASTIASPKSKSKEFPHLLSPKSITKYKPSSPTSAKETAKNRNYRATATKKASSNKLSSPLPPEAPCSPTRPLNNNLSDGECPASPQTEAFKKQIVTQDGEERGADTVFLSYMEGKKGRRTAKGKEVHAEHLQSDAKTKQNSYKALPTELLAGPGSINTKLKKREIRGQESRTTESDKSKKLEDRKVQKRISSFKLTKHDKSKQSEYSPKIQQSNNTDVKKKKESKKHINDVTDNSDKDLGGTTKRFKTTSSAFDMTTPVLMITNGNETISVISTENNPKDDAIIQTSHAEMKLLGEEVQKETHSVESTPKKAKKKVKAASDKSQSKPVVFKPKLVKQETTPVTYSQSEMKKSSSVKSTPVEGKNQKRQLKEKETKKGQESDTKAKHISITSDSADDFVHDIKAKLKRKNTETSSLQSSQHDKPPEPLCDPISPQSPNRKDVLSVSGAKTLQGSGPVSMDSVESEADRKVDKTEKPGWEGILRDAASLLPAAGMASTAIGLLVETVTNVDGFQSDSDKSTSTQTPLKARQFTKQKAVMQPSFSSTLSHLTSNEKEDSTQENAPMSILSESESSAQHIDCDDGTYDAAEQEAVKSVTSEQVTGKGLDTSHNDDEEKDEGEKTFNSEDDVDSKKDETNTEDDEEGESGSDVEKSDSNEGSESISDTEAVLKNDSAEGDEDQDNKSEEEEETNSSCEEEGSDKSDATEAEEEEEESKMETDEGSSDSEVSETSQEEEEGKSKESTEEESEEEEEDSMVSKDEEEESSDESEDAENDSQDSEEEEDGEGSETANSAKGERTESDEEEEEETEEQEDDSTESEDEEKESEEDTKGEADSDEKGGSQEEEDEKSYQENEEEGEEGESADDMEAVNEATEDEEEEEEEEGESEGETTDEEEVEEKKGNNAEEEGEDDDGESESEEAAKDVMTESGEEEDEEEDEDNGAIMRQSNQDNQSESKIDPKDEESDDEEYEEESNEGEIDEEEGKERETESEGEEEEEDEEENEQEEDKKKEEEEEEGDEESEEEEENEEGDEEGEEEGEEENEEEEGEDEEEEEENEGEEEEEQEEEGKKEEKDKEKLAKRRKEESQKPPPAAPSDRQQSEAPKPAPRTKRRPAEENKQDGSQQFWNNVLPQYLDLQ